MNHGRSRDDKWKLDRIVVTDLSTSKSWTFPKSEWVIPYKLDYSLDNFIYPAKSSFSSYDIAVFTGNHGDSANKIVFIQLYGTAGTSDEIILTKSDLPCFKKGAMDTFHSVIYDIGVVNKIKIGLVSTTKTSSWYLKHVDVVSLSYKKTMSFPCHQLFEASQETVFLTLTGRRKMRKQKSSYVLTVYSQPLESSNLDGFLGLYLIDPTGSSDRIILCKNLECFTHKCINKFKVKSTRMDGITSLSMFHDSKGTRLWIDKILVEDEIFDKFYDFVFFDYMTCGLSYNLDAVHFNEQSEDDKIVYHMFLNIGTSQSSERMSDLDVELIGGTENRTVTENVRFEKNLITLQKSNHFRAKFSENLSIVRTLILRFPTHVENHTFYLENVLKVPNLQIKIVNSTTGVAQIFPYEKTFEGGTTLTEDIRLREVTNAEGIVVDTWRLIIFSKLNHVEISFELLLVGSLGVSKVFNTGKIRLKSESTETIRFESLKVGYLKKLRVWHVSKTNPFSKITIGNLYSGHFYVFYIDSWFKRSNPNDHSNFIEMPAEGPILSSVKEFVEYIIRLKVKQVNKIETKMIFEIFGENDDSTGERVFSNRSPMDEEGFEKYSFSALSIGQIERLRLGHTKNEDKASWLLEYAIVECPQLDQMEEFVCERWFSPTKDDGLCLRVLKPGLNPIPKETEYTVSIATNKSTEPSKLGKVYISLVGTEGETRKLYFGKKSVNKGTSETQSNYSFTCHNVGPLISVRIGSSVDSEQIPWRFESVEVSVHNKIYYFYPDKLISRKCTEIEVNKSNSKKCSIHEIEYKIIVYTGDKLGAGTDSNVFINIYGNKDVVYNVKLTNNQHHNKFERGKHDVFVKMLKDVGMVNKIDLMHDSFGMLNEWYVDKVEIVSSTKLYLFKCEQWIKKTKGSPMASVSLTTDSSTEDQQDSTDGFYTITIYTGSQFGAGTDASVFIVIHGKRGSTELINLSSAISTRPTKSMFSRNSIDVFNVNNFDVGDITKIKLMHSAAGIGADWFVKRLEILYKNKKYNFAINQWVKFDNKNKEASIEVMYEK